MIPPRAASPLRLFWFSAEVVLSVSVVKMFY